MAKKQEASAKKPKAAPRAKAKPTMFDNAETAAGPTADMKKRGASPTATSQRELSSEAIGAAAGQVWSVLADRGGQTLAALKKSVDAPDDHVMLALGWLAREDKLAFQTSGRTITVSLR